LEIFVSNDVGTPSGPRILFVSTPQGPSGTVTVTVTPPDYLGAPASVTTAAVVFPRTGSMVSPRDQIFARGLVAATGTGPIHGAWTLDGQPYDRFVIHAAGGLPIPVGSEVPVPISEEGDHAIRLEIDQPQRLVSGPVLILRAPRSESSLRLIAPADGTVVRRARTFSWTPVPGAQAYEVVFQPREQETPGPLRFRTTANTWQPSAPEWGRVEQIREGKDPSMAGRLFWSVRALFPGDVPGRSPPPRALQILLAPQGIPSQAQEAPAGGGGVRLFWKGGSRGLIYRIGFFRPGEGAEPLFSALTHRTHYTVPPPLLDGISGAMRYRIEALAPGGETLAASGLRSVRVPTRTRHGSGPAGGLSALTSHSPQNASRFPGRHPELTATWSGRAKTAESVLLLDGTDVTPLSLLSVEAVRFRSLLPLAPGEHSVLLRFGERTARWKFVVEAQAETPPAIPTAESAQAAVAPGDWRVDMAGFVTLVSGSDAARPDTAHLTVSSSALFAGQAAYLHETVDLAAHHELEESRTLQDSRNWIVRAGTGTDKWRADALVGYSPPSTTAQAHLLSTGLVRGGAEVTIKTPLGRFGSYGSFDPRSTGQVSSTAGAEQRVRSGSYELPLPPDRFLLRGIYLDVRDEGNPLVGVLPSRAKTYGAVGRWTLSPAFSLLLEGARSEYAPSGRGEESGNAFRLQAQGLSGNTGYVVILFQTDARFFNPVNPALTPPSQTDRRGGEVGLSQRFGTVMATLNYRLLEGGITSGLPVPDATGHSGALSLAIPLSANVQTSLAGIFGLDRGDGGPGVLGPLPKLDRVQYGGRLTVSEIAGPLALFQTVTHLRFDDRISTVNDLETTTANLTANGHLHPDFRLALSAAFSRVEGSLSSGNENVVVFLQPTWSLTGIRVLLAPRASYARTETRIADRVERAEQYQALAYWSPLRAGRFEAILGLSGEWTRSRANFGAARPNGFDRRFAGTFALRWGAGTAATGAPMPSPVTPEALPVLPAAFAFRGSSADPSTWSRVSR
jgi:hypothetical protein